MNGPLSGRELSWQRALRFAERRPGMSRFIRGATTVLAVGWLLLGVLAVTNGRAGGAIICFVAGAVSVWSAWSWTRIIRGEPEPTAFAGRRPKPHGVLKTTDGLLASLPPPPPREVDDSPLPWESATAGPLESIEAAPVDQAAAPASRSALPTPVPAAPSTARSAGVADAAAPDDRIFVAIGSRDPEVVRSSIAAGANVNEVMQGSVAWSALMLAVETDNPPVVEALLEAGALVNYATPAGWTALHHAVEIEAARRGGVDPDLRLIRPLVAHGADCHAEWHGADGLVTPVDMATREGITEAVDLMTTAAGGPPKPPAT